MDIMPLLKLINEDLILEQFSNWVYKPPQDPEQLLYDFYFFTLFADEIDTNNIKFDQALKDAVEDATDNLRKHMLKALKFAISSEFRHIWDATTGNPAGRRGISDKTKKFINTYEKFLRAIWASPSTLKADPKMKKPPKWTEKRFKGPLKGTNKTGERANSYKAVNATIKRLRLGNADFAQIAEELFKKLDWDSAYGGEAWRQIAEGYRWLLGAEKLKDKITYIDHAYDLQHNNNTVFEKVKSYYKEAGGEYKWLERALDWKRDVQDIRGFYNKVSGNLKPVVAYAAKNIFGKTMQDYKDPTPKRVWDGGQWKDKVWDGGIWRSGDFRSGTWKDGIFEYGQWWDGLWEKGHFKGGTWHNGKWKGGKWNSDAWWKNGKIWSKKFKKWINSQANPNQFKKEEQTAKDVQDLEDKVEYY